MPRANPRFRPLLQIAGRFAGAGLVMFLMDAAVFRYAYPQWVEPDSTIGSVEMRMWNERQRARSAFPELLAIGDSRMPLFPRMANEVTAETGYFFASISSPGTSPRCWYYMLRDADPDANLYRAIIIPEYHYADRDSFDRYDERIRDLNYIVGRLRLTDVVEFASSFYSNEFRFKALRGALFKGFVYQTDFREFLKDPLGRIEKVEWYRRDQWEWVYNYEVRKEDLVGLRADWENNRLEYTDAISPDMRAQLEKELLRPLVPDTDRIRAYRRKWYGKVLEHYASSDTRIVFLRMARGPVVRPDRSFEETSVIKELVGFPNVVIVDEHAFDSMEDPSYFMDPLHMNAKGSLEFSRALAQQILSLLESRRSSGS